MDRAQHGDRPVSITYAAGSRLLFIANFGNEFDDTHVQDAHALIAKYRAGAWSVDAIDHILGAAPECFDAQFCSQEQH